MALAASRAKSSDAGAPAAQPQPPPHAPLQPERRQSAGAVQPAPASAATRAKPRGSLLASCVVHAAKAQGAPLPTLRAPAEQPRGSHREAEDPRTHKMQLERMNSALLMV